MRKIGNNAFINPMPVTVASAVVDGRVNHLAVGWITRVNLNPPMLAMGLNRHHYTNKGIRANREVGVTIPSEDQIRAVDYVGVTSGTSTDKSGVFDVFYGSLAHAPLIRGSVVTLACRLVQTVELPSHDLFVAEIVEAYAGEGILIDDAPSIEKLRPLTLTMPDNRYWGVGEYKGRAWSIGKGYAP